MEEAKNELVKRKIKYKEKRKMHIIRRASVISRTHGSKKISLEGLPKEYRIPLRCLAGQFTRAFSYAPNVIFLFLSGEKSANRERPANLWHFLLQYKASIYTCVLANRENVHVENPLLIAAMRCNRCTARSLYRRWFIWFLLRLLGYPQLQHCQ